MVKCPKCKKPINNVAVYSKCWQKATVNKNGKITDYGNVEEVLETLNIEHESDDETECFADVTELLKE